MIAEKAGLRKNHPAVELTMSSPAPSTHKRIGRGVRNFDSVVWDRGKETAVFSGNDTTIPQNPVMKNKWQHTFGRSQPLSLIHI